jgi:hypothetical protein
VRGIKFVAAAERVAFKKPARSIYGEKGKNTIGSNSTWIEIQPSINLWKM